MELQVVLIGAVVFVISAVLIYLISAFTMKEKTFEEVIAEQKREQAEQLMKEKQEKKAEKDARKRFKAKGKVKADQSPKVTRDQPQKVSFSEADKEPKMVNIELEPEIIEPVDMDKPLKMSKGKKDKPAKPILHNKGEKTMVVSEEFVEEIIHRGPAPKDDVELKHIQENKKSKKELKKEAKRQEEQKPIVEEIMKVTETKVHAAAPSSSESRINFKDVGNNKLIASVKAASLSDNEAQTLFDILMVKQGGAPAGFSGDWNKKSQKGDPVALLRKQLEEKERSLQEEQQMVMAANTKLKEIRQDLNQEKVKYQAMEKSLNEKVEYQNRDVQALHSRIQHAHEQHMVETNQMRAMIQKLEAQTGDQSTLKRLVEENNGLKELLSKTQSESLSATDANNLKQKVSIMEKELSSNALKLNASENTKKALEQKLAKREAELQKYESHQTSNENTVQKRVDEISEQLRKAEAKNSSLSKDNSAKDKAVETAQNECRYLKTKLQELEGALTESDQSTKQMEEKLKASDRQKVDIEGNLKNLQKKFENFDKEKAEYLTEIKNLKQENSNLSTELKTTKESVQKEATVQKQQNGDLHAEAGDMIAISEHEKQLAAKNTEVSSLTKEVESKLTELSSLKEELEKQKKKNNELREKNWKAMDALEKSEKLVSEKVESAIKARGDEVAASQGELESFDKSVMQRLFPEISVKDQSHKEWMTEFEKQVSSHLVTMKQQTGSSDTSAKLETRIQELESQNKEFETRAQEAESKQDHLTSSLQESESSCSKLQAQVSQYRNVLAETENKLTQLENSVEAEEKKWQEKFDAKELELQQAQQEVSIQKQEAQTAAGSQEDISDIGFAYRCVEKSLTTIVDEMKERVSELESELSASEKKCSELESQVKEAENKASEYNVQIVELKQSSANITVLTKDVEELRNQFDAEKKKNKDLASQIVKLNGIIKTGHDALTQEQNLVKKLQEQVSSGSTNQNSSTAVPNESNKEINELRTKLHDKEKQLEKEINSNKLLSQRLAQLGVMASSQSSLNEAGTSV